MTPEEWLDARAVAEQNMAWLRTQSRLAPPVPSPHVLFEWPLRPSGDFDDYSYYATISFPDHAADTSLLDFECGERTYDGHNGADSILWPFWWYKVDHEVVEIVAAAGGVIIDKADGYDDRSCTPGGSSNKVAIRHADGTMAWYLHMKKWSVTAKNIGDTVATGEYLGMVASSGNSGIPHLHFDLRDENWITFDPYAGPCNDTVDGSWWVDQHPYFDSFINAVRTHSAPPVFPPCPQQEIPNFQDAFRQTDTVYFGVYHRDLLAGQVASLRLLRPDGSVALEDSYSITDPFRAVTYALGSYRLPSTSPLGTWRVVVDYEARRYEHSFTVSPRPRVSGSPDRTK